MGGEVECLRKGLIVHLELVVLGPVARDGEGVGFHDRREADHLEEPRHTRTVPDDELVGERIDLTDDHRLARLDVRKERVENTARALRAARTRAPPRSSGRSTRLGGARGGDDVLHAPLEHADVDLAGDHVGCGRLERESAVEASQRLDDQRRLSRAGLADEQHGPRRLGGQAATIVSTAIAREPTIVPGACSTGSTIRPSSRKNAVSNVPRRHWSTARSSAACRFAGPRREPRRGAAAARAQAPRGRPQRAVHRRPRGASRTARPPARAGCRSSLPRRTGALS